MSISAIPCGRRPSPKPRQQSHPHRRHGRLRAQEGEVGRRARAHTPFPHRQSLRLPAQGGGSGRHGAAPQRRGPGQAQSTRGRRAVRTSIIEQCWQTRQARTTTQANNEHTDTNISVAILAQAHLWHQRNTTQDTAAHHTMQHNTAQHNTQHNTPQHSARQQDNTERTAQDTAQYNTAQHSTARKHDASYIRVIPAVGICRETVQVIH